MPVIPTKFITPLAVLQGLAVPAAILAAHPAWAEVSFLDHRGVLIELEHPAERVATVIGSNAVLLHRAVEETAEHIVGSGWGNDRLTAGIYSELMPELMDIPFNLSNEWTPNVEALLALNPDLVIQFMFDPANIEPMERVGLTVVGWDCCTEQQRRDYITLTGYATGRIDRAQIMLELEDKSNAALRETFTGTDPADYVSLLEVDQINDQIRVIANSSRDYGLSAVANLAADGTEEWWRTIDAEQFLAWNPEFIIVSGWQRTLQPSDFYDHPLLANVAAVKNRRVYRIPMFNSNPDAPEIHLTAQWLGRLTHPDQFSENFREIVRDTYATIYGTRPTDAQLDMIFEIEANSQSVGYAELFGG